MTTNRDLHGLAESVFRYAQVGKPISLRDFLTQKLLTEEEAQKKIDEFFKTYEKAEPYLKEVAKKYTVSPKPP